MDWSGPPVKDRGEWRHCAAQTRIRRFQDLNDPLYDCAALMMLPQFSRPCSKRTDGLAHGDWTTERAARMARAIFLLSRLKISWMGLYACRGCQRPFSVAADCSLAKRQPHAPQWFRSNRMSIAKYVGKLHNRWDLAGTSGFIVRAVPKMSWGADASMVAIYRSHRPS
jgi:hypothetical protein